MKLFLDLSLDNDWKEGIASGSQIGHWTLDIHVENQFKARYGVYNKIPVTVCADCVVISSSLNSKCLILRYVVITREPFFRLNTILCSFLGRLMWLRNVSYCSRL